MVVAPRIASALVVALTLATGAARAKPPRLDFQAPPELTGDVAELRWLPPDRWQAVLDLVGLDAPGAPIRVLLVPEGSPLAQRTPRFITGFAVPEQDTVVLLSQRALSYPYDALPALLTHEVTHVMLWRAAGGRPLPRWFQEGVALYAARERGLADHERLLVGGLGGVEPSTAALDRAFGGSSYGVDTAYAVSGALVQDLVRAHGTSAVGRIAAEVRAGRSFPAAFQAAAGIPLSTFEAAFWRRFHWRYRWLPFLTSGATLWMAITALALLAIARRRQKDAAIRRRWDEEEALAVEALAAATSAAEAENARDGTNRGLVSRWGPH